MKAYITRLIMIGHIPSSIKYGAMQHTATSPKMNYVNPSYRELYLVFQSFRNS